jgi:2-dehydro-3-deoxygluconokinase
MPTVLTFGEIMMRLATPARLRFEQTPHLDVTFGGGEANVAVSLSRFGNDARFASRLPDNDWGDRAAATLLAQRVDTTFVARGGDRIGVYFLETGAGPRASKVIYDRADSAISQIEPGDIDWQAAMKGVDWFHWTGITPALGQAAADETRRACEAAKAAGATVSVDLNYRKKLWTKQQAGEAMAELMPFVDVCIANEEDAESVFGIKGADVESGKIDKERYADVARQLTERFDFKAVAITLRESISASYNGWSAMLYKDGTPHFARRYEFDIIDRVGGGDSFAAGLIHALLRGDEPEQAVNWAVAASALKHTISGDLNLVTADEVDRLAGGDVSGRVQR